MYCFTLLHIGYATTAMIDNNFNNTFCTYNNPVNEYDDDVNSHILLFKKSTFFFTIINSHYLL